MSPLSATGAWHQLSTFRVCFVVTAVAPCEPPGCGDQKKCPRPRKASFLYRHSFDLGELVVLLSVKFKANTCETCNYTAVFWLKRLGSDFVNVVLRAAVLKQTRGELILLLRHLLGRRLCFLCVCVCLISGNPFLLVLMRAVKLSLKYASTYMHTCKSLCDPHPGFFQ